MMESIDLLDISGDHALEYDEFAIELPSRNIFDMLDINKDDHVDQAEIQKALDVQFLGSSNNKTIT